MHQIKVTLCARYICNIGNRTRLRHYELRIFNYAILEGKSIAIDFNAFNCSLIVVYTQVNGLRKAFRVFSIRLLCNLKLTRTIF